MSRGRGRPRLTEEEKAQRAEAKRLAQENMTPEERQAKEYERELQREENKYSMLTARDKAEIARRREANQLARQSNAAIVNKMMTELLEHPKTPKVLNKIMQAALDDDHKGQTVAWKIIADRVLPMSYFEKDKNANAKAAVAITITSVGGDTTQVGGDTIDGDYTEE